MAKIALRAYNREIETMIERGQVDEAIAHCKYILKFFPKHLDTYRLLGKAFLESQRYGEAADILQRILSVQPDDFVAQIGTSIIREDEGNLDAAIYHMERAFEIQPSNIAVQNELRRLYGRRDGIEPPKLRLTRGALVRMYGRGELYRQAIAEARAALVEDPKRLDIEIILAKMYFLNGQKIEATEISSRLVSKLPYCIEANRILAKTIQDTTRAESAKAFEQKLIALDPYLDYLTNMDQDVRQVPDNAVTLDRLVWTPSADTDQPAWAQNLGVKVDDIAEKVEKPSWISDLAEGAVEGEKSEPVVPFSEEPELFASDLEQLTEKSVSQPQESSDVDLPDWMRSAGWSVTEHPTEEGYSAVEDEAAPAEVPDWLKEIAPAEPSSSIAEIQIPGEEWLSASDSERADIENLPTDIILQEKQTGLMESDSEQMGELIGDTTGSIPDWLEFNAVPAGPESEEKITSFEESPDNLVPQTPVDLEAIANIADKVIETPSPEPAARDLSDEDQALAWLEALAARQGAEQETLITNPEERIATPPEWVNEAAKVQTGDLPIETVPTEEPLLVTEIVEPIQLDGQSEEISEMPLGSDFPNIEITEKVEAAEPPILVENELLESESISEVAITSTEPSQETQQFPELVTPVEGEGIKAESTTDEDAAFAWLESLAAKQGAETEGLLVDPAQRLENPPEWILQQSEQTTAEVPPVDEAESSEIEPVEKMTEEFSIDEIKHTSEPEIPEWLQALEEDQNSSEMIGATETTPASNITAAPELSPATEPSTPDWILEIEQPTTPEAASPAPLDQSSETTEGPSILSSQVGQTRPLPAWLAANEPQSEKIVESPVKEPEIETPLPEWLRTQEAAEDAPVSVSMSSEQSESAPALPEWLQNIEPEQTEAMLAQEILEQEPISTESELMLDGKTDDNLLKDAQLALQAGQLDRALQIYNHLVNQERKIDETIHDLRDALYRFPVESDLWQTLGDAYFKNNHIQEALDAYTKAEELLK